jgi:hypothetical protein
MFLQMDGKLCPDRYETLAARSVFVKNRFIIKAHYCPCPNWHVKGAPLTKLEELLRVLLIHRVLMNPQETPSMTEKPTDNAEKKIPGPEGYGEEGTGPDSPAAEEQRVALRKNYVPRLVERVTALRGQSIGLPPEPKSVLRRRTQADIYGKDPEIPYVKFEIVLRDLVCSLMERQDRMNEEIFYQINDLRYRLEDLEEALPAAGGSS